MGRKLAIPSTNRPSVIRIDTYQPREGSETFWVETERGSKVLVYLPIYLARGRKLIKQINCFRNCIHLYSYLSTSRGAGNLSNPIRLNFELKSYRYLSTSRGAGNLLITTLYKTICRWYSYLSTSRGAGNLPIGGRPRIIIVYRYLSTTRGAGNTETLPTMISLEISV